MGITGTDSYATQLILRNVQYRVIAYKSQRIPTPAARSLLFAGLTSSALKFAKKALSASSGKAEADHRLPLSPWSSKPSFQLPEKKQMRRTQNNTAHYTTFSLPKIGEVR